MPRVSPGKMSKDTPDTACTTPALTPPRSRTTNSWTTPRAVSSGSGLPGAACEGTVNSGRACSVMGNSSVLARVPAGPPVTGHVLGQLWLGLTAVVLRVRPPGRGRAPHGQRGQVRRPGAQPRDPGVP